MIWAVTVASGRVHVVRVTKTGYVDKHGRQRDYSSAYLRRTYREGGKVKNETVANLSSLPAHVVDLIDAGLKGTPLVPASEAVTITRSVPHGHVAAAWAMASRLGLPGLLGPAGRERDLALALIVSRAVAPASKLATVAWWADTTLGEDLGVAQASTGAVYAAMDWLESRQDAVERQLARRHLGEDAGPAGMALLDLSSSWLEGRHCPLAARGYSRDGKKGRLQIEYALLTDPEGRPVAVRVLPGNTGDPAAFTEVVKDMREKFRLEQMVMVGDRGMITKARIGALNTADDGSQLPDKDRYRWITALRAPAIRKLMADDGPLQMSLFDQQNLAEIRHPDYPGERLVACRNPVLAEDRARTREELLAATEQLLKALIARVDAGRLSGKDKIGVEAGKVIGKYKTGKHFTVTITDTALAVTRRQDQIDAEAALDGLYVLRTPVPASELGAGAAVTAYKNLKHVERDFRHLKTDDLDLRPVWHRLEERVKAHVLICTLALYLTWHLRKAWAPLTFTDQNPPEVTDPVAPAQRSADAIAKASRQQDDAGQQIRSYQGLLDHLATMPRNQVRFSAAQTAVPMLTEPTPVQRHAFELIGAPIPLTLR
jgi:hypothetical protein